MRNLANNNLFGWLRVNSDLPQSLHGNTSSWPSLLAGDLYGGVDDLVFTLSYDLGGLGKVATDFVTFTWIFKWAFKAGLEEKL